MTGGPPHRRGTTGQAARSRTYMRALVAFYGIFWTLLALDPHDRADWALENVLVLASIIGFLLCRRRLPREDSVLSNLSLTLIFVFFCVHAIGAHYTYAQVPYDQWLQKYAGFSLNGFFGFTRNHFDRLAHFLFGLLLAYPLRETLTRALPIRGIWRHAVPLSFMLAMSMIFELFEWAAAIIFGGDLGIAYLGTQGDVWDAQKDMALVGLGAIMALAIAAFLATGRANLTLSSYDET